jgi:hypothetical protein
MDSRSASVASAAIALANLTTSTTAHVIAINAPRTSHEAHSLALREEGATGNRTVAKSWHTRAILSTVLNLLLGKVWPDEYCEVGKYLQIGLFCVAQTA